MTTGRQITIKLDAQLLADLDATCEERVVGRNLLITHLLRDGLKRLVPLDQITTPPETQP